MAINSSLQNPPVIYKEHSYSVTMKAQTFHNHTFDLEIIEGYTPIFVAIANIPYKSAITTVNINTDTMKCGIQMSSYYQYDTNDYPTTVRVVYIKS